MKFIIRDTVPCYVSWYYEVEAEDADEAFDIHCDGAGAPTHHEIGDTLDWVGGQETTVVDQVPLTAIKETDGAPVLDDETYPITDWQYEVANGDTMLGYSSWLIQRKEAEDDATPTETQSG